ncbi:MAG: tRNA pseudouridine(38-40) synthase TruA [Brevefilum sp.]|nr:tRNA pseudouridine(38-40) synthase TruA [Brevefilum sp.]MDT8381904.1 tRNA pseudouridine(38-40) synthase TruA [Brevefilum sp.]MDW7754808.1 tRNA pseudouridine(38-40) synthase TruA [Brevefilum sp.]
MGLAHYKVILSYNGSEFAGFQRQKDARTVQSEFEAGLRKLGWQGKSILAAGRTDTGVHAVGQVVSFHLDWQHSLEDLRNALNYYFPEDMAVQSVEMADEAFHPRFDAQRRCYRYRAFPSPVRDPIREVFAWRVWPEPDMERMQKAGKMLIGVHDFQAFGSPTSEKGVTIREVFDLHWQQDGEAYAFEISANAFLYHMVRRIVFVLVKIGQGEVSPDILLESLQSGNLSLTGLAPATGLVLKEVRYS